MALAEARVRCVASSIALAGRRLIEDWRLGSGAGGGVEFSGTNKKKSRRRRRECVVMCACVRFESVEKGKKVKVIGLGCMRSLIVGHCRTYEIC